MRSERETADPVSRVANAGVAICTYNPAASLGQTPRSLRKMSVPSDLKRLLIEVYNNSMGNTRALIELFFRSSGLNVRYVLE